MSSPQTTVLPVTDEVRATFGPSHFAKLRNDTNRALMVRWINADLTARASHDVRHSIVLYDAQGDFLSALPASIAELSIFEEILQKLFDQTPVRFYSKGIA